MKVTSRCIIWILLARIYRPMPAKLELPVNGAKPSPVFLKVGYQIVANLSVRFVESLKLSYQIVAQFGEDFDRQLYARILSLENLRRQNDSHTGSLDLLPGE